MNTVPRLERDVAGAYDNETTGSNAQLTSEQWDQLRSLAATLSAGQALWVSGYLAGLGHAAGALPSLPSQNNLRSNGEEPASETRRLTILYGTETGNAAGLARRLAVQAQGLGLSPVVADMGDYKPRELKNEEDLLIIVSTYGEGDPPQQAAGFFEFLDGRKAPKLDHMRYAVLALGDSAYEFFCEAGIRMDRRLEQLGAKRLYARTDCDIDYDEPAAAWTSAVLAEISSGQEAGHAARAYPRAVSAVLQEIATPAAMQRYDKRNPYPASVIENLILTGRGSSKETRHVELSIEGSELTFEPGDALGMVPRNAPEVVDAITEALGLDAALPIVVKDATMTLGDALSQGFEITTATPRFLEHWAGLTAAADLRRLLEVDNAAERMGFLRQHHIIDIIRRYPVAGLAPKAFASCLRPLQPRLYSIASSLAAQPDDVHLTVATVRYMLHDQIRLGVASGQLANRAAPDTTIPVYIQENPHFRLPADQVPIIMIGAGTGVAPFRAFLQEREIRGATGRNWLFFGERNFRSDFLYQTEWQTLIKDGLLTRMDVAFSRDQAEKAYVQHRLLDRARDVYAWLEEGAHIYVCGDATFMAPDVRAALTRIVEQQGGLSATAAEDYVNGLQRQHRYQQDIY